MLRFSVGSANILKNILKQNLKLPLRDQYNTASIEIRYNACQIRRFSKDSKYKVPLAHLISNFNANRAQKVYRKVLTEAKREKIKKRKELLWRIGKVTLALFGFNVACLYVYLVVIMGTPDVDEEGHPIKDKFSKHPPITEYILRSSREINFYLRLLKKPRKRKMLPDPLPYPYVQPEYVLVLEVDDVLVHRHLTEEGDWIVYKRPMLEWFLDDLKDKYEIIFFSSLPGEIMYPIMEALDPNNVVSFKLVREATEYNNGDYVKNIKLLNRDMSRVIVVDWNKQNNKYYPENLFAIKRWRRPRYDTLEDASLYDLHLLLDAIAVYKADDVRRVMRMYNIYDDPIKALRKRHERLIEAADRRLAEERAKYKKPWWLPSFFSREF